MGTNGVRLERWGIRGWRQPPATRPHTLFEIAKRYLTRRYRLIAAGSASVRVSGVRARLALVLETVMQEFLRVIVPNAARRRHQARFHVLRHENPAFCGNGDCKTSFESSRGCCCRLRCLAVVCLTAKTARGIIRLSFDNRGNIRGERTWTHKHSGGVLTVASDNSGARVCVITARTTGARFCALSRCGAI